MVYAGKEVGVKARVEAQIRTTITIKAITVKVTSAVMVRC